MACAGGPSADTPLPSGPMPVGNNALPPRGLVQFCRAEPHACSQAKAPSHSPVTLTPARWAALASVNARINRRVRPVPDQNDRWQVAQDTGDCEDIAMAKQAALIALGWPRASLLIATAETERGEAHAVLVAVTDQGDFVLDSRVDRVMPWRALPYRWIARQSPGHALRWQAIAGL